MSFSRSVSLVCRVKSHRLTSCIMPHKSRKRRNTSIDGGKEKRWTSVKSMAGINRDHAAGASMIGRGSVTVIVTVSKNI